MTALAALFASNAQAQIDSAAPLLQGEKSKHLWTVPGVQSGTLGTVFSCTNTSSQSIRVGIEVFDVNGVPSNDPSATSQAVAPSATVNFATGPISALFFEVSLGRAFGIDGGAARILATGPKIVCSAYLIGDPTSDPLGSIAGLTVVKKTKQKGD